MQSVSSYELLEGDVHLRHDDQQLQDPHPAVQLQLQPDQRSEPAASTSTGTPHASDGVSDGAAVASKQRQLIFRPQRQTSTTCFSRQRRPPQTRLGPGPLIVKPSAPAASAKERRALLQAKVQQELAVLQKCQQAVGAAAGLDSNAQQSSPCASAPTHLDRQSSIPQSLATVMQQAAAARPTMSEPPSYQQLAEAEAADAAMDAVMTEQQQQQHNSMDAMETDADAVATAMTACSGPLREGSVTAAAAAGTGRGNIGALPAERQAMLQRLQLMLQQQQQQQDPQQQQQQHNTEGLQPWSHQQQPHPQQQQQLGGQQQQRLDFESADAIAAALLRRPLPPQQQQQQQRQSPFQFAPGSSDLQQEVQVLLHQQQQQQQQQQQPSLRQTSLVNLLAERLKGSQQQQRQQRPHPMQELVDNMYSNSPLASSTLLQRTDLAQQQQQQQQYSMQQQQQLLQDNRLLRQQQQQQLGVQLAHQHHISRGEQLMQQLRLQRQQQLLLQQQQQQQQQQQGMLPASHMAGTASAVLSPEARQLLEQLLQPPLPPPQQQQQQSNQQQHLLQLRQPSASSAASDQLLEQLLDRLPSIRTARPSATAIAPAAAVAVVSPLSAATAPTAGVSASVVPNLRSSSYTGHPQQQQHLGSSSGNELELHAHALMGRMSELTRDLPSDAAAEAQQLMVQHIEQAARAAQTSGRSFSLATAVRVLEQSRRAYTLITDAQRIHSSSMSVLQAEHPGFCSGGSFTGGSFVGGGLVAGGSLTGGSFTGASLRSSQGLGSFTGGSFTGGSFTGGGSFTAGSLRGSFSSMRSGSTTGPPGMLAAAAAAMPPAAAAGGGFAAGPGPVGLLPMEDPDEALRQQLRSIAAAAAAVRAAAEAEAAAAAAAVAAPQVSDVASCEASGAGSDDEVCNSQTQAKTGRSSLKRRH